MSDQGFNRGGRRQDSPCCEGASARWTRLASVLDEWASPLGGRFAWEPDRELAYTRSRGAWHLSTREINGRDDWISVHPHHDGRLEVQLVAEAGHVEVTRIEDGQLARTLEHVLDFFQGWTDFMSQGPGIGH